MPRKRKIKQRRKTKIRRQVRGTRANKPVSSNRKKTPPKRSRSSPKELLPKPRLEAAVLEMNRGRSLTAAAKELHVSPKQLQKALLKQGLGRRKGRRWVTKDKRTRRIPVMTGGRFRVLAVRGYEQARLVGEHHHAAAEFIRTNNIALIEPFKGQSVQAANGRRYVLETDPNALHRIEAMESPPFHEVYEITSPT